MDEPNEHPELHLFNCLGLGEVGAEPPILLGRVDHVIVDPATSGGLQQRVVQKERETTTRSQHACDLGDGRIDRVDVLEHQARHHGIERSVRERQLVRSGLQVARPTAALVCDANLIPGRVDADNSCTSGRHHPRYLAVTATHVENRLSIRKLGRGEREDLLHVLRVGALGEAVDPPLRVVLPQILLVHREQTTVAMMKFSVWPDMSYDPLEVLEVARWADTNGLFGVWYADHYMPNTGDQSFAPGDSYECWALLPAIAAVTERVRVGSLVTPTSIHHPAVLANRATTIDHISRGRMVLGIGAGWQINEHHAFGIELEPAGKRVTRFDEAIQIIRSMLVNDRTTFDGSMYQITDAPNDPKPLQDPLPILVGTGSPRMLRITARHADEWNTWGHVELAAKRRATFATACESVGRDPSTMHTSVNAMVLLTDDSAAAASAVSAMPGRMIAGSAAQLVETFGAYGALGFDEFIVPDWNFGDSQEARLESLSRLQSEVFAQFS